MPGIGKIECGQKGHCNVWFYAGFNANNHIACLEVQEITEYGNT